MKQTFLEGDLIETLSYKGLCVYGIVIESVSRYHYTEVRILKDSKIVAVVHDGRKGGIKLIQRINDEERATKQSI